MTRVIVTGSSGFLGQHFLGYISSRADILTVSSRKEIDADVHLRAESDCDGLKEVLTKYKPDLFYHLAGVMKSSNIGDYYRVNVQYAESILKTISMEAPTTQVVLIGSGAEYGKFSPTDLPLEEDFTGRPGSHYGRTKLAQTQLGIAYAKKGLAIFLPRIFNLVGPNQTSDFVIGKVVNHVVSEHISSVQPRLDLGYLGSQRDFVDVRDAARILWDLPTYQNAQSRVINICTGEPVVVREIVNEIVRQGGMQTIINEDSRNTENVDIHYGNSWLLEDLTGIRLRLDIQKIVEEMLEAVSPPNFVSQL